MIKIIILKFQKKERMIIIIERRIKIQRIWKMKQTDLMLIVKKEEKKFNELRRWDKIISN